MLETNPTPGCRRVHAFRRPATGFRAFAAAFSLFVSQFAAIAQVPPLGAVVINEVFYHPPDDQPSVQWIELANRGTTPVDLAGWSFSKGVEFTFPAGTKLPRARSPSWPPMSRRSAGPTVADVPVAGAFTGRLSSKGERIELRDADGKTSDWVHYRDRAPWSVAADGAGRSLERIDPGSRSDIPANWVASMPGRGKGPYGTPGRANDNARTNLPPIPSEVRFDPLPKDRPNPISVRWNDADGVVGAAVEYRVGNAKGWGPRATLPMRRVSGDGFAGGLHGRVAAGSGRVSVVRFRLSAKRRGRAASACGRRRRRRSRNSPAS